MPEVMVEADITFPPDMPYEERDALLRAESEAVRSYIANGEFRRVWRTYGNHHGNHGHLALWNVDHPYAATYVRSVYAGFPLFAASIGHLVTVRTLQVNPNDPAQAAGPQLPEVGSDEHFEWARRTEPDLQAALDRWLEAVPEDAADSPLDLAEAAFTAGWQAAQGEE